MRAHLVLGVALLQAACLQPGAPYLSELDSTPPQVLSTRPALRPDGGVSTLASSAVIEVTFSEAMDPRSVRPGINVTQDARCEGLEEPLLITVPPPSPTTPEDLDEPYTVRAVPMKGEFKAGATYGLALRTLLADAQGNPLAEPLCIPFEVNDACSLARPVLFSGGATTVSFPVDFTGANDDFSGSCNGQVPDSPERAFRFVLSAAKTVHIESRPVDGGTADPVIYLRKAPCGSGVELACSDEAAPAPERIHEPLLEGEYYLFVEQKGASEAGPVEVTLSLQ